MDPTALAGGFEAPTSDAQAAFRAALSALAEPGTAHAVKGAQPPEPMSPAMGALALALCDADTPVFLDEPFSNSEPWFTFQAGAPRTADRETAAFAFMDAVDIAGFSRGAQAYPDRSTTVVMTVAFTGARWRLSGPGIDGSRDVHLDLPDGFAEAWADNRSHFPCGVDVILVDRETIMGLPRTTKLERI